MYFEATHRIQGVSMCLETFLGLCLRLPKIITLFIYSDKASRLLFHLLKLESKPLSLPNSPTPHLLIMYVSF